MFDKRSMNALLKHDFYSYVQRVFVEVTGGEKFIPNWHIEVLCHELEQVRRGKTKRLIINVPPRSLKSIIVNVAFSTWVLGHNPREKVISASYSSDLADKFARDSKIVMESKWYRELFPKSIISKSRSSSSDFNTISRGGRYSTSVDGSLTGRGGNLIIIDDPIKPNETQSENSLNKVNEWYKNTLLSRLDDKENGAIIVVMQRVHENDLTGCLLENPDIWRHIKMPQIAIDDEIWNIGTKTYRRAVGTVLNKNHTSLETSFQQKQEFGSYVWSGQYQQDPCPIEGGIIKEEWLQYYDGDPVANIRLRPRQLFISWDTANKIGDNNDYSACCVILMTMDYKFYLLDIIRGRWEMPELLSKTMEIYNYWKYSMQAGYYVQMLIEDKASGTQLFQILNQAKDNNGYPFDVKAIKPSGDKISRVRGASVFIEMGHVLFPKEYKSWWQEFKKELLGFPGGKYDDQVDAVTQCITFPQSETN